jgi:hypothetical protein
VKRASRPLASREVANGMILCHICPRSLRRKKVAKVAARAIAIGSFIVVMKLLRMEAGAGRSELI